MKRKERLIVSLAILLTILLAACQPQSVEVTRVITETEVVTEQVEVTRIVEGESVTEMVEVTRIVEVEAPAELEDITLSVWYGGGSPEVVALVEERINEWATNYEGANVTIDFTNYNFEQMTTGMRLALDGRTGPDVAYAPPGPRFLIAWADAGHITDLTDIAEERGWTESFPQPVIDYFNPTGRLYGMPFEVVTVGVFYNSTIYEELGLQPPATFEEFEEQLATIQAAGITPMVVGGAEGWPIMHVWDQLLHGNVPYENLSALWHLDPTGSWNTPEMLEAAEKLESWFQAGYFNEGAVGVANTDAVSQFIAGDAALFVGGSWNNPSFAGQPEFEVQFFPMPQMNPDLEWHMGGYTPNNSWTVPLYSRHPDVAIDLVDYMISEEVMRDFWDLGTTVAYQFGETPEPLYPLQGQVYEATQNAMTGFYSDSGNSEIASEAFAGLQELAGGRMSAQQLVDTLQEKYLEVLAAQEQEGE